MIILKWLVNVAAILISSYIIPGVNVKNFWTAVWLSIFFGFVNITLKPLLIILTLPINILTLGLFTLVINALMVLLARSVIKGFSVEGFWVAMLFSIVLSVVSYLLNHFIGTK
ncbi:MAG: phage holin family protein [Planctomycetes bacterium]|jgi:putative membrane protein|nr:phage holin family protein [Planctomycetota bacterium]